MAQQQIWGTLSRAVGDETLIDEAIGEAVAAHNDDPEAHLSEGQSLTSHRAAEIIDHLAESVVNDKLAPVARYFTAIVDPADENSYDTIQAAMTYAYANGFGNIYIAPGTHYFTGDLTIDPRISLYGGGSGETIILPQNDNTQALLFQCYDTTVPDGQFTCTLRDLTIGDATHRVNSTQTDQDISLEMVNVNFAAIGTNEFVIGLFSGKGKMNITGCQFHCEGVSGAIDINSAHYKDCTFYTKTTDGTCVQLNECVLEHCFFKIEGSATRGKYIYATDYYNIIKDCHFYSCANAMPTGTMLNGIAKNVFLGNAFELVASQTLTISQANTIFCNNTITGGATPNLAISAGGCIIQNNVHTGVFVDAQTGTLYGQNSPIAPYTTVASTATAMALANNLVVIHTPTGTKSVTTDVPPKGSQRILIILTSGTTSYTLTFSTGFKTTGTLATGTTSARRFVMSFVSDGTQLIECSRTAAIA